MLAAPPAPEEPADEEPPAPPFRLAPPALLEAPVLPALAMRLPPAPAPAALPELDEGGAAPASQPATVSKEINPEARSARFVMPIGWERDAAQITQSAIR